MLPDKICYTCLRMQNIDLIDIRKKDIDRTSYMEKLVMCLSNSLNEFVVMKMCLPCIKHLRIAYDFVKLVKKTQESLMEYTKDTESETVKTEQKQIIQTGSNKLNVGRIPELRDDLYENDNNDYFLFELADNDEHNVPSIKCDKCELDGNNCDEHVCEIKKERIIESDGSSSQQYINLDINSIKNKLEVTKKVKLKTVEGNNQNNSYECLHCDRVFSQRSQLTKHMARVHVEKKFMCKYCLKGFKEANHLREHLTKHTGEKNYSCPICGKTFLRASSQRRHMKSHALPPGQKSKRTPFLCTVCGKSFPFSNGVQRHMRMHLGIRRHECEICKRKFTQSSHLLVHMRTHTGEKPYICDICGEAFALNVTLRKHIEAHRNIDKIEYVNEATAHLDDHKDELKIEYSYSI